MGGGPPGFRPDSPRPAVLGNMANHPASRSPTGLSPAPAALPRAFGSDRLPTGIRRDPAPRPTTPMPQRPPPWRGIGLGMSPFRSPLLRASLLLPAPRGTEMFQFPRFPAAPYGFRCGCPGITRGGLPHSETPGSMPVDGSPGLFAVPRVLHRPSAPRHPPRAPSRSAPPRGGPEPPGPAHADPDPYSTFALALPPLSACQRAATRPMKNPLAFARGIPRTRRLHRPTLSGHLRRWYLRTINRFLDRRSHGSTL